MVGCHGSHSRVGWCCPPGLEICLGGSSLGFAALVS